MRTASTIAALGLVAGTSAQYVNGTAGMTNPMSIAQGALQLLSQPCRDAITNITSPSSPILQCLRVDALLPAILTNGSIIEPVDEYLQTVCASAPCTNETVNNAVETFIQGCSSDLNAFGVSNDTIAPYISEIYPGYLLARDVACLKTDNETYALNSTDSTNSTNATAPVPAGNATANGTFCLTSLALELQDYLGVNLTNSYVDTVALGGNSSALQAIYSIPETAVCNDCIFAAVELINEQYPAFGEITVNSTSGRTIDGYLNDTCTATGLNVTNDGELPDGVFEGAVNATSNSTSTVLPTATASSIGGSTATVAGRRAVGAMAEKRRWIGQI